MSTPTPSGSQTPSTAAGESSADVITEEPRLRPRPDSIVYVVRHSFHQTLPGDLNHAIATAAGTPVSNVFPLNYDDNDNDKDKLVPRESKDEGGPADDPEDPDSNRQSRQRRPLLSRASALLTLPCRATSLVLVGTAVAMTCLLPDGIFLIYAYYFSYADIFFNSRTAVSILRTAHTEGAFKFFFWVVSGLVCVPHAALGFGLAALCHRTRKRIKMRYWLFVIWMAPSILLCLLLTSLSFWIRPVVRDAYQAHVFAHTCRATGWDLDIVLTASPAALNNPSVVGRASISSSSLFPGITHDAQLIRRAGDSPYLFDFVPLTPGADNSPFPFTSVAYDWQNRTYSAAAAPTTQGDAQQPSAAIAAGTFTTTPELSFPSLHLAPYDSAIPFHRPGYRSCWPSAATLTMRRSSAAGYPYSVLRTLTHRPGDRMQMKVCAMAGSEIARELQISLGVVFIQHFHFATCVANGGAVPGEL
jgi:hypothetical protein